MKKDITPKEYMQNVEEELYKILEKNGYQILVFPSDIEDEKKLKRYYISIISILYKQLCCNDENNKEYNGLIKYIIEEIEANINNNNLDQAYILLTSYYEYILKEMKKYFKRKHQNYILKNLPLQRIQEQAKTKELLKINPFMLQECYEYFKNPLTPEEQLIGEILEMVNQSQNGNNIQDLIIEMIKKYNSERFDEVLLAMICNVYQNSLKTNNKKLINLTQKNIENSRITNQDIIKIFIDKDGNNTYVTKELICIVQAFIDYNKKIKEGHLKCLETQTSYQYIKERLKKPN